MRAGTSANEQQTSQKRRQTRWQPMATRSEECVQLACETAPTLSAACALDRRHVVSNTISSVCAVGSTTVQLVRLLEVCLQLAALLCSWRGFQRKHMITNHQCVRHQKCLNTDSQPLFPSMSLNPNTECVQLARETTCLGVSFQLPDGQMISVAQERFWAPEVLFNPSVLGVEAPGLSETIHDCIHSLPIDTRLGMYKSVLIAGGSMMLPGMSTRLERDLRQLYIDHVLKVRLCLACSFSLPLCARCRPRGLGDPRFVPFGMPASILIAMFAVQGKEERLARLFRVRVLDPPVRRHVVYTGAAILGEVMADFDDFWVSRAAWQEDPKRAAAQISAAFQ